jgi:prefoldin beta subunit
VALEYLINQDLFFVRGLWQGDFMAEAEEFLQQFQIQNQQLQMVMAQKQNLVIQNKEIEKAMEELEKSESEDVYKSVGPILVKSDKKTLIKELGDNKEETDIKIKALESQEKKLKEKMKNAQEKLQNLVPKGQGG